MMGHQGMRLGGVALAVGMACGVQAQGTSGTPAGAAQAQRPTAVQLASAAATAPRISASVAPGPGGTLRLMVEARLGIISNITVSPQGNAVRIDLRDATRDEAQALARALGARGGEVRGARAVQVNQRESYVWVELARLLDVADQTIVALPGERSRWELVLSEPGRAAAPGGAPLELRDLVISSREDLIDVRLSGSAELTAEITVLDQPPRLVVDLPGASPASVERFVANYRPGPVPAVRRVSTTVEGGVPRVVFDLSEEVDLVDSDGVVRDGQGQIRISLARDARAGTAAAALRQIESRLGARQVDFSLAGVPASQVRSYALADPPRLVMDVLGMSPQQAMQAAQQFKPAHPGILGARVESTRLGSARLVFDLASPVTLVGRGSIAAPVAAGDAYAVATRIPADPTAAGFALVPLPAPLPVSVSQRGPRVDPGAPLLVIKPVVLEAMATDPAQAVPGGPGLLGLFGRSLSQDPRYQVARQDYAISTEGMPQARAAMLPQVTLDIQRSAVNQDIKRASNAAFPTGSSRYGNNSMSLNLTQPLVKLPALVRIDQAGRSIEQARLNLIAAEQDLILRLASAYLNVSAATDGVDLAEAERAATESQLELARERVKNGLGTVVQVNDAEARFSLARAREVEARNRLDDARQGLKEIVGEDVRTIKGFKGDFAAAGPLPAQVDPWVQAAATQNLPVLARRVAVEIAQLEIRRQQAGYGPSVNVVASHSRVDTGGSLYGSGQAYTNNELGIRISMPLFEGGITTSLVREAVSRREKTQAELEQELRRSERQARQSFNAVQASLDQQEALRKAVVAQQSALESREEGLRAGLFTPVAVIDAYRLYYAAKRDYLQARYDYLVNRLKLKQAVGILSRRDLEDLTALMEP